MRLFLQVDTKALRHPLLPLLLAALCICSLRAGPPQADAAMESLARESRRQGGTSLIVARDGRIVYSEYAEGFGPDLRIPALSITKTILAMAGWQLQEKGLWSLQDPVGNFLPSWQNHPARLVDLLGFSAGVSGGREIFYRKEPAEKARIAAERKPQSSPGRDFVYGPASYEIYGEAFARALAQRGGKNTRPLEYLQKQLLAPLSASVVSWRSAADGTPFYSTGMWMSPRQLLALGELIRGDGRLGRKRVLAPGFLRELQLGEKNFPIYHLGVWRNLGANNPAGSEVNIEASIGQITDRAWWASRAISRDAPADLLALAGSGGQRVYVVPSEKLVIVRTGKNAGAGFDDARLLSKLFHD